MTLSGQRHCLLLQALSWLQWQCRGRGFFRQGLDLSFPRLRSPTSPTLCRKHAVEAPGYSDVHTAAFDGQLARVMLVRLHKKTKPLTMYYSQTYVNL